MASTLVNVKITSLRFFLCRDANHIIEDVTRPSLQIPMILSPRINSRYVRLNRVFDKKANTNSLFEEYLNRNVTLQYVENSKLNSTFRAVFFSIQENDESTHHSGPVNQLAPIIPILHYTNNQTVVPPNTTKLETVFPLQPDETKIHYLSRLLVHLSMDPNDGTAIRQLAGDFFHLPTSELTSMSDQEVYIKIIDEFACTFNLYIGLVEGNHRLIASTMAIHYLSRITVTFPKIRDMPFLMQQIPVYLHEYSLDTHFSSDMIAHSEATISQQDKVVRNNLLTYFTDFLPKLVDRNQRKEIIDAEGYKQYIQNIILDGFLMSMKNNSTFKQVALAGRDSNFINHIYEEFQDCKPFISTRTTIKKTRESNFSKQWNDVRSIVLLLLFEVYIMDTHESTCPPMIFTLLTRPNLFPIIQIEESQLLNNLIIWMSYLEEIAHLVLQKKGYHITLNPTKLHKGDLKVGMKKLSLMHELYLQFWSFWKESIDQCVNFISHVEKDFEDILTNISPTNDNDLFTIRDGDTISKILFWCKTLLRTDHVTSSLDENAFPHPTHVQDHLFPFHFLGIKIFENFLEFMKSPNDFFVSIESLGLKKTISSKKSTTIKKGSVPAIEDSTSSITKPREDTFGRDTNNEADILVTQDNTRRIADQESQSIDDRETLLDRDFNHNPTEDAFTENMKNKPDFLDENVISSGIAEEKPTSIPIRESNGDRNPNYMPTEDVPKEDFEMGKKEITEVDKMKNELDMGKEVIMEENKEKNEKKDEEEKDEEEDIEEILNHSLQMQENKKAEIEEYEHNDYDLPPILNKRTGYLTRLQKKSRQDESDAIYGNDKRGRNTITTRERTYDHNQNSKSKLVGEKEQLEMEKAEIRKEDKGKNEMMNKEKRKRMIDKTEKKNEEETNEKEYIEDILNKTVHMHENKEADNEEEGKVEEEEKEEKNEEKEDKDYDLPPKSNKVAGYLTRLQKKCRQDETDAIFGIAKRRRNTIPARERLNDRNPNANLTKVLEKEKLEMKKPEIRVEYKDRNKTIDHVKRKKKDDMPENLNKKNQTQQNKDGEEEEINYVIPPSSVKGVGCFTRPQKQRRQDQIDATNFPCKKGPDTISAREKIYDPKSNSKPTEEVEKEELKMRKAENSEDNKDENDKMDEEDIEKEEDMAEILIQMQEIKDGVVEKKDDIVSPSSNLFNEQTIHLFNEGMIRFHSGSSIPCIHGMNVIDVSLASRKETLLSLQGLYFKEEDFDMSYSDVKTIYNKYTKSIYSSRLVIKEEDVMTDANDNLLNLVELMDNVGQRISSLVDNSLGKDVFKIQDMTFQWDDATDDSFIAKFYTDFDLSKDILGIPYGEEDSLLPFSVIYAINNVDLYLLLRMDSYFSCYVPTKMTLQAGTALFLRHTLVYSFAKCQNFCSEVLHMYFVPNQKEYTLQKLPFCPENYLFLHTQSPLFFVDNDFPDKEKMFQRIIQVATTEGSLSDLLSKNLIWNKKCLLLTLCWDFIAFWGKADSKENQKFLSVLALYQSTVETISLFNDIFFPLARGERRDNILVKQGLGWN